LKGAFAGGAAAGYPFGWHRFAHALKPRGWVIALGVASFAAIALVRLPLPLVVIALAPLGVWIAWRRDS
jgi:hypothetical protein